LGFLASFCQNLFACATVASTIRAGKAKTALAAWQTPSLVTIDAGARAAMAWRSLKTLVNLASFCQNSSESDYIPILCPIWTRSNSLMAIADDNFATRIISDLRNHAPRASKSGDEFTVPLCRGHHRALHQSSNEESWWGDRKINALETAKNFCDQIHPKSAIPFSS